ncbi:MAG: hypothetical protein HOP02_14315 [Methylococcaceae bacterium]|nr:hypothetical protein [Methylococcaceae bacterium]
MRQRTPTHRSQKMLGFTLFNPTYGTSKLHPQAEAWEQKQNHQEKLMFKFFSTKLGKYSIVLFLMLGNTGISQAFLGSSPVTPLQATTEQTYDM